MNADQLIHLDSVPNFEDKNDIKPWLQKIFYPQGIELVIERSDSLKVVFKCKAAKRGRRSLQDMTPEEKQRQEELAREHEKRRKNSKRSVSKFNHCPFRVRATYSLKRKKWSIVVLNNSHSHSLRFNPESDEYKKFKERLRSENDIEAIKKFDELEYRTRNNLPLPTAIIPCDCGLTNEVKSFDVVLPKTTTTKPYSDTKSNKTSDEEDEDGSDVANSDWSDDSLKKVLKDADEENCTFLTNLKRSSAVFKKAKGAKRLKPKHMQSSSSDVLRKNLLLKANQIYHSDSTVNSPVQDSFTNIFSDNITSISAPELSIGNSTASETHKRHDSDASQQESTNFNDFIDDPFTMGASGSGLEFQPFTVSNLDDAVTDLNEIDFTNIFSKSFSGAVHKTAHIPANNTNNNTPATGAVRPYNSSSLATPHVPLKNAYDGLDDCWSMFFSPSSQPNESPFDMSPPSPNMTDRFLKHNDSTDEGMNYQHQSPNNTVFFKPEANNTFKQGMNNDTLFDKLLNKEITTLNELSDMKDISTTPVEPSIGNIDSSVHNTSNNGAWSMDMHRSVNESFLKLEDEHIV